MPKEIRDGEGQKVLHIIVPTDYEFELPGLRGLLSAAHYAKLQRLAKARGRTPIQCIEGFVESCVPDGGGWRHPSLTED